MFYHDSTIEQLKARKMMKNKQNNSQKSPVEELFEALLLLENKEEAERFMRDLCTPQELSALAERWRVCKLLDQGTLSYREIHQATGASLATITRIARFLRNEPHQGYAAILNKMKRTKAQ
jgi:TrpR-related protein YerC/YecD